MAFDWSKYEGGGDYLNEAEKVAIAGAGIPFEITAVEVDDDNEYMGDPKPRFILTINVPNPATGETEERLATFSKGSNVRGRDNLLTALAPGGEHELVDGKVDGEPFKAKLTRKGRAWLLVPADAA